MRVGSFVRVREFPDDPRKQLMYARWKGMVVAVKGGKVLVDTDEYYRRKGGGSPVFFREWFSPDELEPID